MSQHPQNHLNRVEQNQKHKIHSQQPNTLEVDFFGSDNSETETQTVEAETQTTQDLETKKLDIHSNLEDKDAKKQNEITRKILLSISKENTNDLLTGFENFEQIEQMVEKEMKEEEEETKQEKKKNKQKKTKTHNLIKKQTKNTHFNYY
eukprot:Anaeramoba_ignava/a607539_2293.p3 GENE.a607539_2293~~a607539_2293.p3  ORF type:complete len:149 (+),score=80.93 a607539_2293:47-493(+)